MIPATTTRPTDGAVLLLGNVLGLAVLWTAWRSAAVTAGTSEQLDQPVLALAALVIALAADAYVVVRRRRSVVERRDRLVQLALDRLAPVPLASPETMPVTSDGWVAIADGSLAHRGGCQLVGGKPTIIVTAADIRGRGLGRCGVCAS